MALPYLLLVLCSSLLILGGGSGSRWKAAAREVPVEYLYPPYNLTYFHFIDTNGVFLRSPNATFSAAVFNAAGSPDDDGQSRFFFSVLHDTSRTPVWTATAGATILQSVVLSLTASGLALSDPGDQAATPAWSTPASLAAPVAALRLLDTGQLALIDAANATLWSSFDVPTDTLLPGMALPVDVPLTATASDTDLSPGAYRLVLTPSDALLQWRTTTESNASSSANGGDFVTYWALSSDAASVQDSNQPVHSMKVNATGIYLLADNGVDAVFTLLFNGDSVSNKLLKVDSSGRLRALSMAYSPTAARATLPAVWSAPASDCDLPLPCGSLGLCTPGNNASSCMCPDAFSTHTIVGCAPADGAELPIPAQACRSNASLSYGYMSLGDGVGYFGSKFAVPTTAREALPACRDLCSANCSCLGFLYKNSSRSCFLLHDQIGSVLRASSTTGADAAGFIKTLPTPSASRGSSSSALSSITIVFGIVLPTMAGVFITFLLYVLAVRWLKNRRGPDGGKKKNKKQAHGGHGSSWFMLKMMSSSRASSNAPSEKGDADHEDEDDDEVLIPGLPTRFTFADLEAATGGFRTQIGSGGFGSVYRGELPDRTTVAVKRMNNLGTQGRREFLTEIAVIGSVHHVNLVKLRGFCADHSRQLMLVYEFMSRGSLDQSLFLSLRSGAGNNTKPPAVLLEWAERVGVCVGAARGLAYLHAGCDRKILHCDVKPENILLDARGGVKIADFGLAKLLSPEQSGLFTTMRGTRGYLAPEWLTNAPVTDKADVYSFGMVLLEIVRGAKNSRLIQDETQDANTSSGSVVSGSASSSGSGGSYFPAVALEAHEQGGPWQRYAELVDPRLEGRADAAEVARVVRVALCCLHEDASLRPAMTAVAAMLDGSMEVCEPRTEQLAYLRMYGRGIVGGGGGKWKGSGITTGDGASSSWSPPSCVSAQQLSAPR